MTKDPIMEELHRQRAEEMERVGFDTRAYYEEIKQQEKRSSVPVLPPPEHEKPSPARKARARRR